MDKEIFKLITCCLWAFTFRPNRDLMGELWDELLEAGLIDNKDEVGDYCKERIDKCFEDIKKYTVEDYNIFIEGLIGYIKENYKNKDFYLLCTNTIRYFLAFSDSQEQFQNPWLNKIFINLRDEARLNCEREDEKAVVLDAISCFIK